MALSVLNIVYTLPQNPTVGSVVTCNTTFNNIREKVGLGYWLAVKDSENREYKLITADWNNGIFVASYASVTSGAVGRTLYNNYSITHTLIDGVEKAVLSEITSTYAQNGYEE